MIRVSRPLLYEFEVLCDGKVESVYHLGDCASHYTQLGYEES
jgi:hypothetical protein